MGGTNSIEICKKKCDNSPDCIGFTMKSGLGLIGDQKCTLKSFKKKPQESGFSASDPNRFKPKGVTFYYPDRPYKVAQDTDLPDNEDLEVFDLSTGTSAIPSSPSSGATPSPSSSGATPSPPSSSGATPSPPSSSGATPSPPSSGATPSPPFESAVPLSKPFMTVGKDDNGHFASFVGPPQKGGNRKPKSKPNRKWINYMYKADGTLVLIK